MKKILTKTTPNSITLIEAGLTEFGSRKGGINPPPSVPRPNFKPEGQGPKPQKSSK